MRVAIVQARFASTRLPGKVMLDLLGRPMLAREMERIGQSRLLDSVWVATSTVAEDDVIAALCDREGWPCYRGSLDDVLERYMGAAEASQATQVVRLTGDCPLHDGEIIDRVMEAHHEAGTPVTTNAPLHGGSWPDGVDTCVIERAALEEAARQAVLPSEREHVVPFFLNRPTKYAVTVVECEQNLGHMRWSVDEPEDFEFVQGVYRELYSDHSTFGYREVVALLSRRPELRTLNSHHARDAGYWESLAEDSRPEEKR